MSRLTAGIGPMQGQSNHFYRYAPEKIPYGIKRYQAETERLYGVFNDLLEKSGEYLVGNKYSIVDISGESRRVRRTSLLSVFCLVLSPLTGHTGSPTPVTRPNLL